MPAQRARIGLLDRILTRIKTTETTGRDESAFMTDLRQVKAIVECCSDRSLVLIDEFGKGTRGGDEGHTNSLAHVGTCQQDGMALFSGLLTHLANLPATPLLIAITHMHEIFKKGLVESPDAYAYCQMRVHMDRSLCYLYRLESGMAGHSYAMECAREASIENAIIDKGKRKDCHGYDCINLVALNTFICAEYVRLHWTRSFDCTGNDFYSIHTHILPHTQSSRTSSHPSQQHDSARHSSQEPVLKTSVS